MSTGAMQLANSTGTWRHAGWWIFPLLTTAAFAYALMWTTSLPGIPVAGVGLVGLFGFAAILLWLVCVWRMSRSSQLVVGILSVAMVVGSIAATATGTPLRARFGASAAAFEAVVADADAHFADLGEDRNPESFPIRCPTKIGQFRIAECVVIDGTKPPRVSEDASHGYLFMQTWNALTDDSGIVYLPDGVNAWSAWDKPRHLSGSWYSQTCGC